MHQGVDEGQSWNETVHARLRVPRLNELLVNQANPGSLVAIAIVWRYLYLPGK